MYILNMYICNYIDLYTKCLELHKFLGLTLLVMVKSDLHFGKWLHKRPSTFGGSVPGKTLVMMNRTSETENIHARSV